MGEAHVGVSARRTAPVGGYELPAAEICKEELPLVCISNSTSSNLDLDDPIPEGMVTREDGVVQGGRGAGRRGALLAQLERQGTPPHRTRSAAR